MGSLDGMLLSSCAFTHCVRINGLSVCYWRGQTTVAVPQIDDRMMRELGDVRAAVKPTDTLLVVDAMTGQEAAGLVKAFNDAAEITGASRGHSRALHCSLHPSRSQLAPHCLVRRLPAWSRRTATPQRSRVPPGAMPGVLHCSLHPIHLD